MIVKSVNNYLVQVSVAGVTLQVSRVKAEGIGYYLGVYIIHSDGFSDDCHGIIGKETNPTWRTNGNLTKLNVITKYELSETAIQQRQLSFIVTRSNLRFNVMIITTKYYGHHYY